MHDINSTSWGNALATDRGNSLSRTVPVGYLLCSIARIYDLCVGSLDQRKVREAGLCCGQDGYQAQVLEIQYNTQT